MRALVRRGHAPRPCAAALAIVLMAGSALAQTPPAPSVSAPTASDARTHFERGVTFYAEGDYPAALVEFKRAYSLAPAWQVLFDIGQSYFQIHDYARALTTLQEFVEEGQDRIPDERRQLVDSEHADLVNRVGHAAIASNVAGATVTIDGEVVGVTPLAEPVLVSVGIRKVVVTSPGGEPVEQAAAVSAGETLDLRFDFAKPPPSAPSPAAAPPLALRPARPAPAPGRNRGPAIAAISVGAASAVVGAVFGALALHEKSALDAECIGKACVAGSQRDIDAVGRDGTISTIAFGVAGVGAALGLVLWVTVGGGSTASPDGKALPSTPVARVRLGPGFVDGSF
jgi:hypothetical protein